MHFTKMEGLGNDYVYVNCFKEKVDDPQHLARLISDRHRGVGSDGLILIGPSDKADFSMSVYNSDGSAAEMCGNGIRCAGKYVYDNHMTDRRDIAIETLAGVKHLRYISGDDEQCSVMVDMGKPKIGCEMLSVTAASSADHIDETISVAGENISFVRVSVGNPHAVVWTDEISMRAGDVAGIGSAMERHEAFPAGTNVEFVKVLGRDLIQMRVWERGSGETLACGTGACAAAAACMARGYTGDEVTVRLVGGELSIKYDRKKDTIYMTGPARTVFCGCVDIKLQEE